MKHPFEWLSLPVQKTLFIIMFIMSIVLMVLLSLINTPLVTSEAPCGIISYELAYELDTASAIITSWKCIKKFYAGISLGLDYLFIVAYTFALGLGCVLAARCFSRDQKILFSIGIILSWLQLVTGFLDCIENIALIQFLLHSQSGYWPVIAFFSAVPKFIIFIAGLLYIIIGFFTFIALKIYKHKK